MDGTVGLSLQLATASVAVRGRLELKPGEILSLRVGESLGRSRYEVTVRGVPLIVRSSIALPSGTLLRAKVLFAGKRIELKVLEPALDAVQPHQAAGTMPASMRPMGANDPVTVLIRAMRRTGVPVTAATMSAINAMLPPARRKNPSFVRFATVLYDKHLRLDPERLEELYLTVNERPHGDMAGGSGSRQETGGGPQGRNPERGTGGASPTPPVAEEEARAPSRAPAAPAGSGLTVGLRRQFSARVSNAVGWPALINHPVGEHESWVVVPFSFVAGETSVEGSIRLLIAPPAPPTVAAGARLPVARAVVAVTGVGAFEISGAPPRRVTVYADTDSMRERITALLPELGEKLRNLGVEIDDTNNGGAVFDGFSAETVEIRGVDATA